MTIATKTTPEQDSLTLTLDALNAWTRGLERSLAPWRLSVAQYRILDFVGRAGVERRLTPSMLAALLVQETHSVSGLLNRLEDRDLITRERDRHPRHDQRVVWVDLTSNGIEVLLAAREAYADVSEKITRILCRRDAAVVLSTLEDVREYGLDLAKTRRDVRKIGLERIKGQSA